MKEFDKVKWLEELACKYEVPVEQVMIAYVVYDEAMDMFGHNTVNKHFEQVLEKVFGVDGL